MAASCGRRNPTHLEAGGAQADQVDFLRGGWWGCREGGEGTTTQGGAQIKQTQKQKNGSSKTQASIRQQQKLFVPRLIIRIHYLKIQTLKWNIWWNCDGPCKKLKLHDLRQVRSCYFYYCTFEQNSLNTYAEYKKLPQWKGWNIWTERLAAHYLGTALNLFYTTLTLVAMECKMG